jgi:hypothetical protein
LLKLQEGDDNTCVGFQVGGALVRGHGNTLVGSEADVAHDGISDSTALGKGAVATESHQVVLGTDQETVTVPGSLVVEGYYTPYTRVQSLSWDATGRVTMDVHALYAVNHVPAPTCGEAELVLPSTTYTRPGDWLVLYVVPPRGGESRGWCGFRCDSRDGQLWHGIGCATRLECRDTAHAAAVQYLPPCLSSRNSTRDSRDCFMLMRWMLLLLLLLLLFPFLPIFHCTT